MEGYLNIFEKRQDDLIKIMINQRYIQGNGVLFLNFSDLEKLDVYYISIYDKENECMNTMFPKEYISYYQDKFNNCPNSLIYFYLYDKENGMHLEVDLDKKSGYTKHLVENIKSETPKLTDN